jgi:hypothetical protein
VATRFTAWVCGHSFFWDCGFESRLGHRYVLCCQVEVSASGWSLVQRTPADCGVSNKCEHEAKQREAINRNRVDAPQKKLTKITLCSRVLPGKQSDFQLVKTLPHFMEFECSLLHSKEMTSCTYRDPDQTSSCPSIHFLKTHFNTILPSMPTSSRWSHSLRSPHKNPVAPFLSPVRNSSMLEMFISGQVAYSV